MTAVLEDPGAYGRVVRNETGEIEKIVEVKAAGDATPEELEIREINSGIYCFRGDDLAEALGAISNDNAQGEYYLPDVLPALRRGGLSVGAHVADDPAVNLGVNNRADLAVGRSRGAAAHPATNTC